MPKNAKPWRTCQTPFFHAKPLSNRPNFRILALHMQTKQPCVEPQISPRNGPKSTFSKGSCFRVFRLSAKRKTGSERLDGIRGRYFRIYFMLTFKSRNVRELNVSSALVSLSLKLVTVYDKQLTGSYYFLVWCFNRKCEVFQLKVAKLRKSFATALVKCS